MEILRRSLNLFNPRLVEIDMIAKVGNWTKEALCVSHRMESMSAKSLPAAAGSAGPTGRRTLLTH